MRAAWLAAIALAGCKQSKEPPPAPPPLVIPAPELKRGQDACAAYVEQACACAKTVPAAAELCTLAKALPEAIDVALEVAMHPDTERKDLRQSADAIRKAIAGCIEQTAKLGELGCPQ